MAEIGKVTVPVEIDYSALATGIEQGREIVRAIVAVFVAEGFTDEQARDLTVSILHNAASPEGNS